jgi:hypothetical protein
MVKTQSRRGRRGTESLCKSYLCVLCASVFLKAGNRDRDKLGTENRQKGGRNEWYWRLAHQTYCDTSGQARVSLCWRFVARLATFPCRWCKPSSLPTFLILLPSPLLGNAVKHFQAAAAASISLSFRRCCGVNLVTIGSPSGFTSMFRGR